jgi:hypothetical protein
MIFQSTLWLDYKFGIWFKQRCWADLPQKAERLSTPRYKIVFCRLCMLET